MAQVYVLHENDEWLKPLRAAFETLGIPYTAWHLGDGGALDMTQAPPLGVFYNRMSASSHTRDHERAPEYTAAVLEWLELHGRTVVNGTRALELEISKVKQYTALKKCNINVPETIVVVGKNDDDLKRRLVVAATKQFTKGAVTTPFVTKHNRGGKGIGVRKFDSITDLESYANSVKEFESPIDGVVLLQRYIKPVSGFITRCEFIGKQFVYAVDVDATSGFQLCPADACSLSDSKKIAEQQNNLTLEGTFCPTSSPNGSNRFTISENDTIPKSQIQKYESFLKANEVEVAGIEFLLDSDGVAWTYDVNTNTNYNRNAEQRKFGDQDCNYGMMRLADYLGQLCWDIVNDAAENALVNK